IGMCGGVSAALSMAIPAEKQHFWGRLGYLLNYNLGRILSYVIAGALVGGLLATTSELGAGKHAIAGLRLVAAFLMIALGLYLAGWWQGVLLLERMGARLWPRLKPLASRFIPFTSAWQALPFGMVWG
ncbi:sulfite exporter TauE/SafE family protein, partial [Pseudomonas paraeruginosa]|uniref:sulfite exporter TauE/SafE family protein n=1 Tax=Pseudomonas paraeruginosa TaxID=2994495 RepID=UPI0034D40A1A